MDKQAKSIYLSHFVISHNKNKTDLLDQQESSSTDSSALLITQCNYIETVQETIKGTQT